MAAITVDSHDVLGYLTLVKNYLSMVEKQAESGATPDQEHIRRALTANQSLIDIVKKKAVSEKTSSS